MAKRATSSVPFAGFDPYKLTDVKVKGRELGHGSYATVLELEYMGLKCAGKKIHEVLLRQGNASYTVRRFETECHLLSQVRHPNVVQFLGVHFQQGEPAPVLVMEFLPTNLTSCIEQYGILPKEISYSILHDVALGLCYLHSQTPPIIHRDLSANNVLLTRYMTAKISDLGVARIFNLNPLQVSHMTRAPGTPAYMPPEVMIFDPKYNISIDEFSYGILMIHMFSGRWPEPQIAQTQMKGRQLVPVTEAERRDVFLQAIGSSHSLMDLILRCINNDSECRAHANEIVKRLTEMTSQYPVSFPNQLEMLEKGEIPKKEWQILERDVPIENKGEGADGRPIIREQGKGADIEPMIRGGEGAYNSRLICKGMLGFECAAVVIIVSMLLSIAMQSPTPAADAAEKIVDHCSVQGILEELHSALELAETQSTFKEQAWTMRHAFDAIRCADVELSNLTDSDKEVFSPSLEKKPMGYKDACREIAAAIERGAPTYNKGDHRGCYNIYKNSAEKIVEQCSMVVVQMKLSSALEKAETQQSFTDRAWTMRHAFDHILAEADPGEGSMSYKDACREISSAISKGAPAYNEGDHSKCYNIYKQTADKIVECCVVEGVQRELRSALDNAEKQESITERAWTMRHAFDAILRGHFG